MASASSYVPRASAAYLANEPNAGVKGLKSRGRSDSDAIRTFENPQETQETSSKSTDVTKQIWGSEDAATIARKHEHWKQVRATQDQEIQRKIEWHDVAKAAVALWLFRTLAHKLGFSARKFGGALFLAGALKTLWSARAPKRVFPPDDIPSWPILGQIGAVKMIIDQGFATVQLERARIHNFDTGELVLFGGMRDMALMDPKDREYMLKGNWKNYVKNSTSGEGFQQMFAEVMGRGIFAVDGDEWQDHRKVASHLFSANGLKSKMERSFVEHGSKLVELMRPKLASGEVFDFQDVMASLTFETICDIAFGFGPHSLEAALRENKKIDFLVRFDRVQQGCTLRFALPGPVWKLMRFLNVGYERVLREDSTVLINYVQNIVSQRKGSNATETQDDLLSMYVRTAKASGKDYMMDDRYLVDAILNFMIAGRDTTSCTLTNLFKLLPTNPDVEIRMLEELDRVVGRNNNVGWDNIRELPYCGAVVNEVLRMYPPVGGDSRWAVEDDVMPSGVKVRAGQRVSIANIAIGRDPSLWSEPDKFLPERWLQEGKPTRRPDEYIMPVFWGGPRLCLGKDMARLEAISIAYTILAEYRVVVLPHAEKFINGPVIFYQDGLPVKLAPRAE